MRYKVILDHETLHNVGIRSSIYTNKRWGEELLENSGKGRRSKNIQGRKIQTVLHFRVRKKQPLVFSLGTSFFLWNLIKSQWERNEMVYNPKKTVITIVSLFVYVCVCVYICVCTYVCACMYESIMYTLYIWACMYESIMYTLYICVWVCVCVCMC